MKRSSILRVLLLAAGGCGLVLCSSLHFLGIDRHSKQKDARAGEADTGAVAASSMSNDDIDFALAFSDTPSSPAAMIEEPRGIQAAPAEPPGAPPVPGNFRKIALPKKTIRVLLRRGVPNVSLYTMDTVMLRSSSLRPGRPARGRIGIARKGNGSVSVTTGDGEARIAALPCTLAATSESSFIDLGPESFRGSMIVYGGGSLSIVNYCDVEEYLRGVVPSEMGGRGKAAIEAVKAQAVAARTYAYKRIETRAKEPFDVLRNIEDQVYGGVGSETVEADYAVRATRDLVLSWNDSLADTYYHSTCGGRTANIEDVWDRQPRAYLRSVADIDPDGVAYCARSPKFTWEESWDAAELSKTLRVFVARTLPGKRFTGAVRTIQSGERLPCDRLKTCRISGSGGEVECGGDKARFILRRSGAQKGILPSANFSVGQNGPRRFVLHGKGYGHGVGMCQMGAVGRARQGHSFERILAAYYPGTELRTVAAVK